MDEIETSPATLQAIADWCVAVGRTKTAETLRAVAEEREAWDAQLKEMRAANPVNFEAGRRQGIKEERAYQLNVWGVRRPSQWQPIETAPKDKSPIILWPAKVYGTKTLRACEGWWFQGAECWLQMGGSSVEPTHWQPLPIGPQD